MNILAHRGYWKNDKEKNTSEAIFAALKNGFGFETDVRDYREKLVISHNVANKSSLDAASVFEWLHQFDDKYTFAINIKADGLKDLIKEYLDKYSIANYFLFDMSLPQMVEFREAGLRFFTRQSDVEPSPYLYEDAAGVWIDGFRSVDWISEKLLQEHIVAGKEICLVSPDLHGSPEYRNFWKRLKGYNLDFNKTMLCTDYPEEARRFFNELTQS